MHTIIIKKLDIWYYYVGYWKGLHMYSVGEYIVHPGQGVCQVEAIVEEPMAVYQLMPIGQRHPMRITYPVAGADKLRPVLSRQEAEALIEGYSEMEPDPYHERSNALEEAYFKREIRNGTCEDSMRIVKTFRLRIEETRANNRKPPVIYERILKQASQRSLEELSVALDMSPEDVRMLFESKYDDTKN